MRRAGILLHPTSLLTDYGIGDIGPAARSFVDWLALSGQSIWQVLPLGPTDGTGCPYGSPSSCARNPLLLSIDDLVADGWLDASESPARVPETGPIHYATVAALRRNALSRAAQRVAKLIDMEAFTSQHAWLADWVLYAALCEEFSPDWSRWPPEVRDREPSALKRARSRLHADLCQHTALQWLFTQQWDRLRTHAGKRGISLWGDLPFFVSGGGCDTWAYRGLFRLDENARPTVVSGVPPDLFSKDGQLWGHPLYNEVEHAREKFSWWTIRMLATLDLVDVVRLDHFRGLSAYWEVPVGAQTAAEGRWIPGPGAPLLDALKQRVGCLPVIAEDLGVITPDVEELRDRYALPGMAILQFGFGDSDRGDNAHLPHNHRKNLVVYPGTHDNDPILGWYNGADERTRDHLRRYLSTSGADIAGDVIKCAYRSVADTAIVMLQDVLALGSEARINVPGRPEDNWTWRIPAHSLEPRLAERLAEQAHLSGRLPPTAVKRV